MAHIRPVVRRNKAWRRTSTVAQKQDARVPKGIFKLESNNMNMLPIKVLTDDSGHWYYIPNELVKQFEQDLQNEEMCDSGEFDSKYGHYRTGGDVNIVQLYVEDYGVRFKK